jgi:hypothetical protein
MIAAYMILHYGIEWLKWSVRSVISQVDEFHIFYTPRPSHGFDTKYQNPETREQLYSAVASGIGNGLFWHDCNDRFQHEGYHREFAAKTCIDRGADTIVVVDADEIWPADVLKTALEISYATDVHSFRIGMRHFWRSLKWVCDDPACPTRIIKPNKHDMSEAYLPGKVFHMGYAQTPDIIFYKMQIHGHLSEWRPEWYKEKFLHWEPGIIDVHPTCKENYWHPEPYVDENDVLKNLVWDHPYYTTELI